MHTRLLCKRYASTQTHYQTLSISPTSTQKQIKLQFYALSKIHHPDVSQSKDASTFLKISEAYTCLSDPSLRSHYDSTLFQNQHDAHSNNQSYQQPNYKYTTYRQRSTLNPDDFIQFKQKNKYTNQKVYDYREHQRQHYTNWINRNENVWNKASDGKVEKKIAIWKVVLFLVVLMTVPDLVA